MRCDAIILRILISWWVTQPFHCRRAIQLPEGGIPKEVTMQFKCVCVREFIKHSLCFFGLLKGKKLVSPY